MATITPRSLFLILCASAFPLLGQTSTSAGAEGADNSSQKKRSRSISGETSAALSAGYSYQPQKPVEPSVEEDEMIDQRDVDKPRNEIIRLPKYMVEGERPPVFSERNLYTKQDFATLVRQRYLGKNGLNKYQLGTAGDMYAAQMYWDDERLKNMMEGDKQVSLYRAAGDDAKADQVEKENRSMFLRTNDATSKDISKMAGQRY